MPRGGRRAGAGAPRGNTNALRGGNHSQRLREVVIALEYLAAENDRARLRDLLTPIHDAGILASPAHIRAAVPRIVRILHPMLFDRSTSRINQNDQPHRARPPRPPVLAAQVEAAPQAATSTTASGRENAEEQTSINEDAPC